MKVRVREMMRANAGYRLAAAQRGSGTRETTAATSNVWMDERLLFALDLKSSSSKALDLDVYMFLSQKSVEIMHHDWRSDFN